MKVHTTFGAVLLSVLLATGVAMGSVAPMARADYGIVAPPSLCGAPPFPFFVQPLLYLMTSNVTGRLSISGHNFTRAGRVALSFSAYYGAVSVADTCSGTFSFTTVPPPCSVGEVVVVAVDESTHPASDRCSIHRR